MKKVNKIMHKVLIISLIFIFTVVNVVTVFAGNNLRTAKLADFEGKVAVMKCGGEKTFSAFKGMSLVQGDRLITGKDSWVILEMDDDKEIKIAENTQLNVSELAGYIESQNDQTSLSLWVGKLWIKIKNKLNTRSKFEIKTPTTVMGVRGTMFYVGQEEGATDIAVLEGTVDATAYVLTEQPDGTIKQQEIDVTLEQNQQVTLDKTVQAPSDVEVEQVTTESLDLMVLQDIQQNPEGIDQSLLKSIDEVIEQKTEEKAEEESKEVEHGNSELIEPEINYDPAVEKPELTLMPIPTSELTSEPTSEPMPVLTPMPTVQMTTPTLEPALMLQAPTPAPMLIPIPTPILTLTPVPTPVPTPSPIPTPLETEAPTPPMYVTASETGSSWVSLSWSPAYDNVGVTQYAIYRRVSSEELFREIARVYGSVYEFKDTGLTPGTTYYYYILAGDASGNWSHYYMIIPVGIPGGGVQ